MLVDGKTCLRQMFQGHETFLRNILKNILKKYILKNSLLILLLEILLKNTS